MTAVTLRDFTVSPAFDLQEVDRCLSRWGAAVVPGWLDRERVQALHADWEAIRAERLDPESRRIRKLGSATADYAALYRSAPGGRSFPSIERVFTDPKMVKLCHRYIGRPCLFNEEIYATYDVGRGEEVASSHHDKTYNLKFMIYLHDILESGRGAFSVHPGSQTIGRRQFRDWFDRNSSAGAVEIGTDAFYAMGNGNVPEDVGECVEILAEAGTLIVFGTDVFHRGAFLKAGAERRIIRGHCYPGYALPRGGDLIRRGSRHWLRGEQWEVGRRRYMPVSRDGVAELRDYARLRRAEFRRDSRLLKWWARGTWRRWLAFTTVGFYWRLYRRLYFKTRGVAVRVRNVLRAAVRSRNLLRPR